MDEILIKYFTDSATEEEKNTLLHWLEEKEENRTQFKELYDLWLYSQAALADDTEIEKGLLRLKARLNHATPPKHTALRSVALTLARVAASILLLFSAGYVGYRLNDTKKEATVIMNKLLTGENGKGKYTLPDGTVVWLNANSTLEYPHVFTDGKRLVRLEGEALFEVVKDSLNPFLVQAGEMDVEVLGTRFLVQNYRGRQAVETVLVDGAVKVCGNHVAEHVLEPGQMLAYDKSNEQIEIKTVNTSDYISWIHPKLIFDNDCLADIIINLEKWYGVEIVASPGLAEKTRLSFTVRRESLEEVLKFMSVTTPMNYTWKDDVVYLSSGKIK